MADIEARAPNMKATGRRSSFMRASTRPKSKRAMTASGDRKQHIQSIKERRKAFKYFPVLCNNDMVHGSWWFVWGSVLSVFIACVPLFREFVPFMRLDKNRDTLDSLNYSATWVLLMISGSFFTAGSYGFVRATEDDPPPPLLGNYFCGHCVTDELFAAWCFFIAILPAAPYSLIFLAADPSKLTYMGMTVLSALFILGTYLFVLACYPTENKRVFNYTYRFFHAIGIKNSSIINTHLANDWLAGTWFFLVATLLALFGAMYELGHAVHAHNDFEVFIWSTGGFDTLLYLIGSVYFVCGAYPADNLEGISEGVEEAESKSPVIGLSNRKTQTHPHPADVGNASGRSGGNVPRMSAEMRVESAEPAPMTV